jgi:chromosome partitioning protein
VSVQSDALLSGPTVRKGLSQSLRVLSIANQKGGVGKTTTAINLATALAALGERVLILDLDPQGNASTGLGIAPNLRQSSVYEVLMGERPLIDTVMPTALPRLSIVPADADLSGIELELGTAAGRSFRLRDAFKPLREDTSPDRFTYVLIDCPPSLNLLTVNAMAASDAVLVPLQCEFFALEGLTQLIRTIERVRTSLNPTLEIQGVVLTMYDRRNALSEQVAKDVRTHFGEKVYETVIPRNVRVSEAPSFGKPVLIYDLKCAGSQAYIKLARELVARERARSAAAA